MTDPVLLGLATTAVGQVLRQWALAVLVSVVMPVAGIVFVGALGVALARNRLLNPVVGAADPVPRKRGLLSTIRRDDAETTSEAAAEKRYLRVEVADATVDVQRFSDLLAEQVAVRGPLEVIVDSRADTTVYGFAAADLNGLQGALERGLPDTYRVKQATMTWPTPATAAEPEAVVFTGVGKRNNDLYCPLTAAPGTTPEAPLETTSLALPELVAQLVHLEGRVIYQAVVAESSPRADDIAAYQRRLRNGTPKWRQRLGRLANDNLGPEAPTHPAFQTRLDRLTAARSQPSYLVTARVFTPTATLDAGALAGAFDGLRTAQYWIDAAATSGADARSVAAEMRAATPLATRPPTHPTVAWLTAARSPTIRARRAVLPHFALLDATKVSGHVARHLERLDNAAARPTAPSDRALDDHL